MPRGKKLLLKDGNVQLVRSYEVDGDRVKFYSIERSEWEEIPSALVDWDATKREQATEAKNDAETLAKAHKSDAARAAAPALDVDASLEVLPGVFLPPGAGAFVLQSKALSELTQAETQERRDKKQTVKQVLNPFPIQIVPTRRNVILEGPRAHLRLKDARPEFWVRMFGSDIPHMEVLRTHVRGPERVVEGITTLFGEKGEVSDALPILEWPVAERVFRYTLEQPLPPGEYALTQATTIGVDQNTEMTLYVWDFGVDPDVGIPAPPPPPKKK